MERRVSVNVVSTVTPDGLPQGWSHDPWPAREASDRRLELAPIRATTVSLDQGPCLYLGPGGQRCSKRAVASSFCRAHLPGGPGTSTTKPARFWAAVAAILGLLWPYLEFIVREMIRWAHSR